MSRSVIMPQIKKEIIDRVEAWVLMLGMERYGFQVENWDMGQWSRFYLSLERRNK